MNSQEEFPTTSSTIPIEQIAELLSIIHQQYGYDFQEYSKTSMLRRISRFMQLYQIKQMKKLRFHLLNNPQLMNNFVEEITVNVTDFFRDPAYFQALRTKLMPTLQTYPFVRIWNAGCSSGEELYATAIVCEETEILQKSRLYGTDISQKMLAKAKTAEYPHYNLEKWAKNYRTAGGNATFQHYFDATTNPQITQVKSRIKAHSTFAFHNLVSDQSFNEFQMISCRNVLIYFEKQLQEKVLKLFYDSLCQWGFLVLGTKESLNYSALKGKFKVIDKKYRIYQKIK